MKLTIETTFLPLLAAYKDLPSGVQISYEPHLERRDIGPELYSGILNFSSAVVASIIANWIYSKIKNAKDRPDFRLRIGTREVRQLTAEGITEIIESEIELEHGGSPESARETGESRSKSASEPVAEDPIAQINKLAALRDAGALSEEEFTAKKTELLSRI